MNFWLIVFGVLICIAGLVTSAIAAGFNQFNTTPFSKYTFSKFCYEFESDCNALIVIGVVMVVIGVF